MLDVDEPVSGEELELDDDCEPAGPSEAERVRDWRVFRALVQGFDEATATLVAEARAEAGPSTHVDLHEIDGLLARGCEPALAWEIVR